MSDPSVRLDPARIEFGKVFCPRMVRMDYEDGAWNDPYLGTLEDIRLHPGAVVLQYGQSIFEGAKAYLTADNKIVLFRPEKNAHRFAASARRLHMPPIDVPVFINAVKMLVEDLREYVPERPGSLYIRPTMIGTEANLGVRSSTHFLFYVMALPTGPYFKQVGTAGSIDILVTHSVGRASVGGTGNVKAAANYAGTLDVIARAKTMHCDQVLFLDTVERRYIEELGGMNLFFVRNGTLVTPPLTDTLLEGVTRDSVIQVARDLGLQVSTEALALDHVLEGIERGTITEAMACGTAAVVAGIRTFHFEDGRVVQISATSPGPVTAQIYERLVAIQYGAHPDTHGWVRPVCDAG